MSSPTVPPMSWHTIYAYVFAFLIFVGLRCAWKFVRLWLYLFIHLAAYLPSRRMSPATPFAVFSGRPPEPTIDLPLPEFFTTARSADLHVHACVAHSLANSSHQVLVDSGASDHMTGDMSLFVGGVSPCHISVTGVDAASNLQATSVGRGSIQVGGTTIPLTRMYFVPGLSKTLLSLSSLL